MDFFTRVTSEEKGEKSRANFVREIDNLDFIVQPVLFLGYFCIEITKEPSASTNPVIKLGSKGDFKVENDLDLNLILG